MPGQHCRRAEIPGLYEFCSNGTTQLLDPVIACYAYYVAKYHQTITRSGYPK